MWTYLLGTVHTTASDLLFLLKHPVYNKFMGLPFVKIKKDSCVFVYRNVIFAAIEGSFILHNLR
jgi:hypothetical protein